MIGSRPGGPKGSRGPDGSRLAALQVSTADRGGGAELSAWNLHQTLRARGIDSWLAVGSKISDDPRVLVIPNEQCRNPWVRMWRRLQLLTRPGTLVNRAIGAVAWAGEPRRYLDVRLRGREDFHYPGTRRLLELTPLPPDLLHCHNLHGWYFDLRELPRLTHAVPTVVDLRDEWLLTGHCAYAVECDRWSIGCGHCPDLSVYPAVSHDDTAFNWIRKQEIFRASRLYLSAPSQWMLDRAVSVLPGPRIVRVIPNAIEADVFCVSSKTEARRRLSLAVGVPIVLTTAHNRFKDLETTLAAIANVKLTRSTAERPQLIVLGRREEGRAVGGWDVRYQGFLFDRTVVADFFRAADVFVHGARAEVFGKTIAEAMACGTATIATRVGGIPEVLEDGETGILVQPRSPQELARAISHLLENPMRRRQIGAQAAKVARVRYSLNRQADDVLDFYRTVIDDWKSRGVMP